MKRLVLAIITLFLTVSLSFAATGTVTVADNYRYTPDSGKAFREITYTFVEAGGAAVDTTKTVVITGCILNVEFIETSITAATTVKLLSSVTGRDILQGLFSDTEASATATADNHVRYPVTDNEGAPICLSYESAYIDISSGNGTESGKVKIIVELP